MSGAPGTGTGTGSGIGNRESGIGNRESARRLPRGAVARRATGCAPGGPSHRAARRRGRMRAAGMKPR
ncbi:hypothetical protein BMA721280_E0411 [Burkholderia mallei 2002721280]|nr:hypothetical protein BMA721280_E0411 [Burkholderia mallei 2002721280]